jgi:nucleoside-diphosphate-sugar epimerase
MNYFITGITGTVVPVIVEDLLKKDADAFFYVAIRGDAKGNGIRQRFDAVLKSLDITPALKARLADRSRLVEIDVEKENLGIDPDTYAELIGCTDKILHGAADVRFDQPYEAIKIANVEFTIEIYNLFRKIREHRRAGKMSEATLYYISTGYAYGIYNTPIPEDYPQFHPGKPDNTYAQTKAEAKSFLLDKIRMFDDRIVIFEPTIIGGSSKTGRTKTYNLYYIVMMLGYLGKLPFLTAPDNRLDIVPVDWVAAVISDIMAGNEYHQGTLRLSVGSRGAPIGYLYETGYDYYTAHNPVPGHVIPKIRFVPRWFFFSMILMLKLWYLSVYGITRARRYRKLLKGISLLEGYFPYITGYKVFENARSTALIEKYTDCGQAPAIHDIRDAAGHIVEKGYYRKTMADTLETGWGGLVDFERLAKSGAPGKSPAAAYGVSRK